MKTEQYVMAYSAEHDRLRAIIPDGFISLRPVFRINAEIREESRGYIEFNTPVGGHGIRGWLNIGFWNDVHFERDDMKTVFATDFLEISFKRTGIEGSCPAERDNEGCFFTGKTGEVLRVRPPEMITSYKVFCDCRFRWKFADDDAGGVSIGKTLPAYPQEEKKVYPKMDFTAENAAKISCIQVLGSYVVEFERRT